MEQRILSFILNSIDERMNFSMVGEEIRALKDILILTLVIRKDINNPVLMKILNYIELYQDDVTLGYLVVQNKLKIFNTYTSNLNDFIEL
jgi:hypothetical protein